MVDGLSIDAPNHSEIIHNLRGMRQEFADQRSALSMRGEFVDGRSDREALLTGSHGREALAVANGFGQVGVKQFRQSGLVIPQVDLGWRAVHEQID